MRINITKTSLTSYWAQPTTYIHTCESWNQLEPGRSGTFRRQSTDRNSRELFEVADNKDKAFLASLLPSRPRIWRMPSPRYASVVFHGESLASPDNKEHKGSLLPGVSKYLTTPISRRQQLCDLSWSWNRLLTFASITYAVLRVSMLSSQVSSKKLTICGSYIW